MLGGQPEMSNAAPSVKNTLVLAAKLFEATSALSWLSEHGIKHTFIELGLGPLQAQRTFFALPDAELVIYLGSCGEFLSERAGKHDGGLSEWQASSSSSSSSYPSVPSWAQPHVRLITTSRYYWSPTASRSHIADLLEQPEPPLQLQHRHDVMKHLEDLPSFTSPTLTLDPALIPPQLSLEHNNDDPGASKFTAGVENMEIYTIAPYLVRVPKLVVLLGVTNTVGWWGHEQWVKNKDHVAALCTQFLHNYRDEIWM